MHECGKKILNSTYERACIAKAVYISNVGEVVAEYKPYYEDIKNHLMISK